MKPITACPKRVAEITLASLLLVSLLPLLPANATEYYADATYQGSSDGSKLLPFRSISEVLKSDTLKAGDTLVLASGFYGELKIIDKKNKDFVTIRAGEGQTPQFSRIRVQSSENWKLQGIEVSPAFDGSYDTSPLLRISNGSQNISIDNSKFWSAENIEAWTFVDWKSKASTGIEADGREITIRDNLIRNVRSGIETDIDNGVIEGNIIENFSGDGILGLGDYTKYKNNTIKNCFKVDDNDYDGFRSWSVGADGEVGTGQVIGGEFSGNRIIYREYPDQPDPCSLQGIAMFDGSFVDWRIENNIIVTNNWHGISVYGGKNVLILHNTVFNPEADNKTWIEAEKHKNGTPPDEVFILNNIAPRVLGHNPPSVIAAGNVTTHFAYGMFEEIESNNFKLKNTAISPVDGGVTRAYWSTITSKDMPQLPKIDIAGNERPLGRGFDAGAYEMTQTRSTISSYLPK